MELKFINHTLNFIHSRNYTKFLSITIQDYSNLIKVFLEYQLLYLIFMNFVVYQSIEI